MPEVVERAFRTRMRKIKLPMDCLFPPKDIEYRLEVGQQDRGDVDADVVAKGRRIHSLKAMAIQHRISITYSYLAYAAGGWSSVLLLRATTSQILHIRV